MGVQRLAHARPFDNQWHCLVTGRHETVPHPYNSHGTISRRGIGHHGRSFSGDSLRKCCLDFTGRHVANGFVWKTLKLPASINFESLWYASAITVASTVFCIAWCFAHLVPIGQRFLPSEFSILVGVRRRELFEQLLQPFVVLSVLSKNASTQREPDGDQCCDTKTRIHLT